MSLGSTLSKFGFHNKKGSAVPQGVLDVPVADLGIQGYWDMGWGCGTGYRRGTHRAQGLEVHGVRTGDHDSAKAHEGLKSEDGGTEKCTRILCHCSNHKSTLILPPRYNNNRNII